MTPRSVRLLTHTSGWGGTEYYTSQLAGELASRGCDVTLLELGHDEYNQRGIDAPFSVVSLPIPAGLGQVGFWQWRRLFAPYRGGIWVLSKGAFEVRALKLDLVSKVSSDRYVTIEHLPADPVLLRSTQRHLGGMVPGMGLWWCKEMLRDRSHLAAPDSIVTVSDAVRNRVLEHGAPAQKVERIYPGIDLQRFRFSDLDRSRQRQRWKVPNSAFVFGVVARFHAIKRLDRILHLFSKFQLPSDRVPPHLVLVGQGPEQENLAQLARKLGIGERVRFVGWVDEGIESAYCAFDCFLMTSELEGLGFTLIEAMACGSPCIATDSLGPREIISATDLGWLITQDDWEGFLKAMREVSGLSEAVRWEFRSRMRMHVEERFDAAKQFPKIADQVLGTVIQERT